MKCPYCNYPDTKVVDSRPVEDGLAIRRRRECERCRKRFTTFEKIENSLLVVIKSNGTRESFDKNKLISGMMKACEKTKVTYENVQQIANDIERALNNTMEKEINSKYIGKLIMDKLRELDQVAYVRFASVYHHFTDVDTFVREINNLLEKDGKSGASCQMRYVKEPQKQSESADEEKNNMEKQNREEE